MVNEGKTEEKLVNPGSFREWLLKTVLRITFSILAVSIRGGCGWFR